MKFDAGQFWNSRLSKGINLQTTGHRAFTQRYNQWLYQAQTDTLSMLINGNKLDFQGKSLLDIGSGGGFFIDYFDKMGCKPIYGIDISKASIEYLKNKFPDKNFLELDVSNPTINIDTKFDYINAFSVMFHIVDDGKFNVALENMISLLGSNGSLIICDSFYNNIFPTMVKHVRMRSLNAYKEIFDRQHIKIVQIVPMYYLLNRVFVPIIIPWVINRLELGYPLYKIDRLFRKMGFSNFNGMKLMLAQKK